MSRFRDRLIKADQRISRMFAEYEEAMWYGSNRWHFISIIFETPDALVNVPGGGEIQDRAPAISAMTTDITGLEKESLIVIRNQPYRVTHVGSDEEGRTRVRLAYGEPGAGQKPVEQWSR